jgi:hypothetical protein
MARKRTNSGQSEAYRRALDAIALQRRNPELSLSEAARRSGTTLAGVRQNAGAAVTFRSGRWEATEYDTLPRRMRVLTDRGYISYLTEDSRDATFIADYNNALRAYLTTDSQEALRDFEGMWFEDEDGRKRTLVTDPKTINRLARAGAVYFLDIYASEDE